MGVARGHAGGELKITAEAYHERMVIVGGVPSGTHTRRPRLFPGGLQRVGSANSASVTPVIAGRGPANVRKADPYSLTCTDTRMMRMAEMYV
jgi:hypothetical protein